MATPGEKKLLNLALGLSGGSSENTPRVPSNLDADTVRALMGGPSDADLMRANMATIQSDDQSLDNKLVAFDNFEQLIENLDNANNMESLGLWLPLVDQLENKEAALREFAAWCVKTAVQNNVQSQERLLLVGALPSLIQLATTDSNAGVRKKAIGALSSATRNYQPSLDEVQKKLPKELQVEQKLDAADMESVDVLIEKLLENSKKL